MDMAASGSESDAQLPAIAFVWENFGPAHAERCAAVAERFAGRRRVVGIELTDRSATYDWAPEGASNFEKVTLFHGIAVEHLPVMRRVLTTMRACSQANARHIFFCHYEHMATLLAAWALRLAGRHVYVMNDSKFDDYRRWLPRELAKAMFYLPYEGALSASERSRDYLRFLGLGRIEPAYDARSVKRIRELSGSVPAPGGEPFAHRHFSIIARFVPKKNLALAIDAYRLYCDSAVAPRSLNLYGSGELEGSLRAKAEALGLADKVVFKGFLQTGDICKALSSTLALILPSMVEQFGNVVIEAQAMGVPVLLTESCGARDSLIRAGVNGFVFEPDNAEGLAYFMSLLSEDEALWRRMGEAAERFVWRCDVSEFAASVERLVGVP